jgi:predicted Co/Zn/Cd cation transporter (cation efflux family)
VKKDYEKIGVKISIVGSSFLALSAVIMALIAKSQAILFDGLFNFITLAMAFASLKVINLVKTPETKNRPFGYMALEPFLNLIKSLVILTLLVVFLVTNIQEICTGGRIISLDMTTLYIFVCLIIYAIIILFLRKYKKRTSSSILKLEINNWYVDALITVGIAISLVIAMIILRMGYTKILPYIDPIIVIALTAVSFPVPLKALSVALKRLLLVSSENSIEAEAKKQLHDVICKYGLIDTKIWGLKSGRTHYLFIYSDLKEEETTVMHLDEIRVEIFKELSKIYPKFWADIMFTKINPEEPFPIDGYQ